MEKVGCYNVVIIERSFSGVSHKHNILGRHTPYLQLSDSYNYN